MEQNEMLKVPEMSQVVREALVAGARVLWLELSKDGLVLSSITLPQLFEALKEDEDMFKDVLNLVVVEMLPYILDDDLSGPTGILVAVLPKGGLEGGLEVTLA